MSFRDNLSKMWFNVQYYLFPMIEADVGNLSEQYKNLVSILELVRIEDFIPDCSFYPGRPRKDRLAIARAFVAKIVLKINFTKQLVEYLKKDRQLRFICGWDDYQKIPSESKFSRTFKDFSELFLPEKVHSALIKKAYEGQIVGQVIKDSTPLEAREKHVKKGSAKSRQEIKAAKRKNKKLGILNSRQKQLTEQNLDIMLMNLPKECDKGMKKSAQGYTQIWKGYKLHAAVDDNCIPLAAIITSASLNDCEAAIPLGTKTNKVVKNFYDLMDAAYDHPEIKEHSISLGRIPIIDKCPQTRDQKIEKEAEKQRRKLLNFNTAEGRRYKERLPKERFNALYKDYYGGRAIYYRGYHKVSCHVMFGLLVIAASSIIKLIQ